MGETMLNESQWNNATNYKMNHKTARLIRLAELQTICDKKCVELNIPKYTIKFRKMKRTAGHVNYHYKLIVLDPYHKNECMMNTLIHELAHAKLWDMGENADHHALFWQTLINMGGKIDDSDTLKYKMARKVKMEV